LFVIANEGFDKLVTKLKDMIAEHQISLLIVGIPYAIDGSITPKTAECQQLLKNLKAILDISVEGFDERYSTWEANTELKKMGYSWQKAKNQIDAMAAAMFLKEYLAN
jgi:putative Holliday junction resolvase